MAEVYVYLPDDEPDTQDYNGAPFHLEANASTRIRSPWQGVTPEEIAAHLVEKLGMWGACIVRGAVKDCVPVPGDRERGKDDPAFKARYAADLAVVKLAEAHYLESTYAWCAERIMEYEKAAKPLRDAGLPIPPETPNVVTARKWEKRYHGKLKDANLIA